MFHLIGRYAAHIKHCCDIRLGAYRINFKPRYCFNISHCTSTDVLVRSITTISCNNITLGNWFTNIQTYALICVWDASVQYIQKMLSICFKCVLPLLNCIPDLTHSHIHHTKKKSSMCQLRFWRWKTHRKKVGIFFRYWNYNKTGHPMYSFVIVS